MPTWPKSEITKVLECPKCQNGKCLNVENAQIQKMQSAPKCKNKQNAEMPPNVNMPKVPKSKQSQNAKNTQMRNGNMRNCKTCQ